MYSKPGFVAEMPCVVTGENQTMKVCSSVVAESFVERDKPRFYFGVFKSDYDAHFQGLCPSTLERETLDRLTYSIRRSVYKDVIFCANLLKLFFMFNFRSFAFTTLLNAWFYYSSIVRELDEPMIGRLDPMLSASPSTNDDQGARLSPFLSLSPPSNEEEMLSAFGLSTELRTPSPVDLSCYEDMESVNI